jgi:hypothetical protein
MSKALIILLIITSIIFLIIGITLSLIGCEDSWGIKCKNNSIKNFKISSYEIQGKKCQVCNKWIETSHGYLCDEFYQYECYLPKVIFKAIKEKDLFCEIIFFNVNYETKEKAIFNIKIDYPENRYYDLFYKDGKCTFENTGKIILIIGFSFIGISLILFIWLFILLIIYLVKIKKQKGKINDNIINIHNKIKESNNNLEIIPIKSNKNIK